MTTLTSIQTETVANILALGENGKKAAGYGHTFLNKKSRGIAAIRRHFLAAVVALGFTQEQADAQWQDTKDVALLEHAAE